jgi:hypothetical protein
MPLLCYAPLAASHIIDGKQQMKQHINKSILGRERSIQVL